MKKSITFYFYIFLFNIFNLTINDIYVAYSFSLYSNNFIAQDTDNFNKIGEALGDLDNDSIPEKVVVYDTNKETEFGTQREIHIFKKTENSWTLWQKNTGAVLPSKHGGVWGDPFQEINIENGAIKIYHFGGSRYKWQYIHQYKYLENDWKLIEATVEFGAFCDYYETLNYNLITGNIIYKKEEEKCDRANKINQEKEIIESLELTQKLEQLPNMNGFYPGNNEIVIPQNNNTIYY